MPDHELEKKTEIFKKIGKKIALKRKKKKESPRNFKKIEH